jgi:hypothetical protein
MYVCMYVCRNGRRVRGCIHHFIYMYCNACVAWFRLEPVQLVSTLHMAAAAAAAATPAIGVGNGVTVTDMIVDSEPFWKVRCLHRHSLFLLRFIFILIDSSLIRS